MSRPRLAILFAALLTISGSACGAATSPLPLKLLADLPLEGRPTRFDYQSYDESRHRLFIAHLGDGTVTVVDTRSQQVLTALPGASQVHGVLAISELGRVYATATGTHQVLAIDEDRLGVVGSIPGGAYPDGLAYAPEVRKLYVSDKTGAVVVIDVQSNRRLGTIALGHEVGNVQYDPGSKHVFANVQSTSELAEIDPNTDRVLARYALPGAKGNHGLLIDPDRRLAFVACEDNARLLVVDLRTKAVVATHSVGKEPDVLAFDPGLSLLYVASESGVLSMFKVADGQLRKLGESYVAPGAHSVAVAPDTHRVYLPLENVGGHPALRVMIPTL